MNNYTFDPTLSCNDDEIEDVWCVSFSDIMSQLGGGKLFISFYYMGHIMWIILNGLILGYNSSLIGLGIIIQPIVSFLEHIALAKSFSKREPQETILNSVS